MSNTIQIKGGNRAPDANMLAYRELGFDFANGDLYIGDSKGNPLLVAKASILSKLSIQNNNLMLNGTTIVDNIEIDTATLKKIIVSNSSYGENEPTESGLTGQLFFRIVE